MNEYPSWFIESLHWIDNHLALVALTLIAITYAGVIAGSSFSKKVSPTKSYTVTYSWELWLSLNFVGGLLGGFFSDYLGDDKSVWVIYGFTLGLIQWFVLRSTLPISFWWAIATAIGWGLAPQEPYGGGITGLLIGLLQVIGLKVKNKTWWVIGSSVTLSLTGLLGHVIIMDILYNIMGPHVSWSIGWGILSLIAAVCLLPLIPLLTPQQEKDDEQQTVTA